VERVAEARPERDVLPEGPLVGRQDSGRGQGCAGRDVPAGAVDGLDPDELDIRPPRFEADEVLIHVLWGAHVRAAHHREILRHVQADPVLLERPGRFLLLFLADAADAAARRAIGVDVAALRRLTRALLAGQAFVALGGRGAGRAPGRAARLLAGLALRAVFHAGRANHLFRAALGSRLTRVSGR